ncbi:MAG TPA: response regulator [Patescibacteria group bacterium]|nr:response regulator [Patescibacteria group bacterium]
MFKLLLVDDERWVRTALRRMIEKTGLPLQVVRECSDGEEAIAYLEQSKVDLVISDIRMPGLNGLALVKELNRRGLVQDVIIISVHDDFRYAQEALRENVIDYLVKPVELPELIRTLGKWLDGKKARNNTVEVSDKTSPFHLSPIEQVLLYLQQATPGRATLSEAARRVHLNPSYLSQLFKQQMNINFVDYVTEMRMKEARTLLTTSTMKIAEIVEQLGYCDISSFSNSFKKTVGCSPSEYRKKTTREQEVPPKKMM